MKRKRLVVRAILLTLLLIGIVCAFSLNHFAENRLRKEIARLESQKINGLYSVKVGKTRLNVWSGMLEAREISLTTDTAVWATLHQTWPDSFPPQLELSVQALHIEHASWLRYLLNKTLKVQSLAIERPLISFVSARDSTKESATLKQRFVQLQEAMKPAIEVLKMEEIAIEHADLILQTLVQKDTLQQEIRDMNLLMTEINFSQEANETTFCREIQLNVAHVSSANTGGTHRMSFDSLDFSRLKRQVSLANVSIVPQISEKAFFARQPYRKDFLAFTCPSLEVAGFDTDELLAHNYLRADSMKMAEHWKLDVIVNHHLPLPYRKVLPHEAIQKAKQIFNIGQVIIKDGDIVLNTRVPGADYQLTFNHAYINAINFSNDSMLMTTANPLQIWAEAQFMNRASIKWKLDLPLLARGFNADYTANIRNLPLPVLNPMFSNKNVNIESGFLQSADITSSVRNGVAGGTVKMQYRDLDVKLLKKKTKKPRKMISNLLSMVLKEDNVKSDPETPFVSGVIEHTRDRQEGFFVFIWLSIQTGMLPSIMPSYKNLKAVIPDPKPK